MPSTYSTSLSLEVEWVMLSVPGRWVLERFDVERFNVFIPWARKI
jgi:hypothetical protein